MATFNVHIRRPTSTALQRQLNTSSRKVIRLANRCINDCIAKQSHQAERQEQLLRKGEMAKLKRKLLRYTKKDGKSCINASTTKSLTKLLQSTVNSVDVMSKYNRMLAVKIHTALMAQQIETDKQNLIDWHNRNNLSALNSANYRQMRYKIKQSQTRLTERTKTVELSRLPQYAPLSTSKKYW